MSRRYQGEFIATGDIIADAVGGKWINPSGAYNVALKENLVELSKAEEWSEAKKEWKATGNVWYIPIADYDTDILPEAHNTHPKECVCGHKIAWHFEIKNTENDNVEIVGSEHIGFWMVIRHMIEDKGIPEDMITEELVAEWIKESVKGMKADWWWKENGEEFTEMFEAVRETDLRVNTRKGKGFYDNVTQLWDNHLLIRKKAEGKFGTPNYGMASIVWRWNHPDNDNCQKNSRGYPNDRLWNDLMMFYVCLDRHKLFVTNIDDIRKNRIEELRLAQIEHEKRRKEVEKQNEIDYNNRRIAQQKAAEERDIALKLAFVKTLLDMGIPDFGPENGNNDWEKSFLVEMREKLVSDAYLSNKQRNRIITIVKRSNELATDAQLAYIRKLGGNPKDGLTKNAASKLIDQIKGDTDESL